MVLMYWKTPLHRPSTQTRSRDLPPHKHSLHDLELKKFDKSGLLLEFRMHAHLPVAGCQVDCRKILALTKRSGGTGDRVALIFLESMEGAIKLRGQLQTSCEIHWKWSKGSSIFTMCYESSFRHSNVKSFARNDGISISTKMFFFHFLC